MFAPAQFLSAFKECAGATIEQLRKKSSRSSSHPDPEADGFTDQLQCRAEPEGPEHRKCSTRSASDNVYYQDLKKDLSVCNTFFWSSLAERLRHWG